MVYNILNLILIISFSGCTQSDKTSKDEVLEIKVDGVISERRYYDTNKKLIKFVSFKKAKIGKVIPIDSVYFQISAKGELIKVNYYNFKNGNYLVDNNELVLTFYENLFFNMNGCKELSGLSNTYLLIEALNDICNITGSVLTNGVEVSQLRMTKSDSTTDGITTMLSYNTLNSTFVGLTEELQSYFNNQYLNELDFTIKDNFLINENYHFSTGKFTREYNYSNNGKLNSILICVRNNNGIITKRVLKVYSYL